MRKGTKLIRREDNKMFVVEIAGHWHIIGAAVVEDDETDSVKMYGEDGGYETYVSANKGHTYRSACSECRTMPGHKMDCSQSRVSTIVEEIRDETSSDWKRIMKTDHDEE